MSHLEMPEEFVLSALGRPGSDYRHEATTILTEVVETARERIRAGWVGAPTTVTIVPSSELLSEYSVEPLVRVLARTGRAGGVRIRLLDVLPLLSDPQSTPSCSRS